MSARRTEPTVHLYRGAPYIGADKTDIRLTWARFLPKPAANVSPITKRKASK